MDVCWASQETPDSGEAVVIEIRFIYTVTWTTATKPDKIEERMAFIPDLTGQSSLRGDNEQGEPHSGPALPGQSV